MLTNKNRTMKKTYYLCVQITLLSLFLPRILSAQTTSFISYGVEQGLAQAQVQTIIQDNEANLWIGTLSGLTKYNGKEFKTFLRKDSLAEDWVTTSCKDSKGNLWFGHWAGGVSMYDIKTQHLENLELEAFTQFKTVKAIVQDEQQRMWIATEGAGIFIYNPIEKKMITINTKDGLASNNIYSLCLDKKGNMWIATDVGLSVYDSKARVGASTSFSQLNMEKGLLSNRITTLALVNGDEVWAGSADGGVQVLKLNEGFTISSAKQAIENSGLIFNTSKGLGANFVNCIIEDKLHNVWVGTTGGGVTKISPFSSKDRNEALSNAIVYNYNTKQGLNYFNTNAVFQDIEGNVWIGTDIGLNKYRGERFQIYDEADGILNNLVWTTLCDKDGNVWIGTNEGLSEITFSYSSTNHQENHSIKNFTSKDGLGSNVVLSSFQDKNGDLWFGTAFGGVSKFDKAKNKFITFNKSDGLAGDLVFAISDDNKGNIWFGTKEGASKFDLVEKTFRNYTATDGLGGNNVYRIFKDIKGNLWFGALGGSLSMFDGKGFKTFDEREGIHHKFILCINEDKKHNLWFGAYGGGLYKYDGSKFTNYNIKEGLATDSPYSIICDNYGRIWIGNSHGIDKFDPSKEKFSHYGKSEGFPGVETNPNAVSMDLNGNLWYGTIMGAVRYCPKEDRPNTVEPQTFIYGLKLFRTKAEFPDDAHFAYNQNHLTFSFVGVSLSNPEKVKYQYKLEGFDKDWISNYTFENEAVYSNLSPGTYTFMVKSCNNDETCNIEPAKYKFTISPPFWRTYWFYSLATLFVLLCIFVIDKIRTQKLKASKRLLELTVEERTKEIALKNSELAEKNKDITDSIRYAKRIQEAILPPTKVVKQILSESFFLYKPKDIVSGDFYWVDQKDEIIYFAAVDCTGHGVPGAFMSIVGHNLLNQSLNETSMASPAALLDRLNRGVNETLKQSSDETKVRDGMDIALCSINMKKMELQFAGAYNPLIIVRQNELIEIKGDNIAIGNYGDNPDQRYTNHIVPILKDDILYVFSDGFADQFGGPDGKKYKLGNFKKTLQGLNNVPIHEQGNALDDIIEGWRKGLMQVDDILVIGVKI